MATSLTASAQGPVKRHASGIDGNLEVFADLGPRELRRLRKLLTPVDKPGGRRLGREGEVSREFIVVISGQVAITIDGSPLAILDEGCFVGEIPMLYRAEDERRHATWHTLGPTRVAIANRWEFRTMMQRFPVVAGRVQRMAEGRRKWLAEYEDARAQGLVATFEDADDHFPVHLVDVG